MCEKRTRKVKKGTPITRLREARRLQRLQLITPPVITSDESSPLPPLPLPLPHPPQVDKVAQNRVILQLAWKTIALMHKNRLIQQKIIALQKETSEFVASVMNNPQNRQQCEPMRLFVATPGQAQVPGVMDNNNLPIKVEPKV